MKMETSRRLDDVWNTIVDALSAAPEPKRTALHNAIEALNEKDDWKSDDLLFAIATTLVGAINEGVDGPLILLRHGLKSNRRTEET